MDIDALDDQKIRGDKAPREVPHTVLDHVFTVETRYRDLKAVGKGSYGIVCSALDTKNNKRVAIKKITPMAHATVDAKHVLREIRLMRYLGNHQNIISLEDIFVREREDELYIVMELLDSDLHRIIQSPQPLSDAHHRYFMYQLLSGVKYLHDNRIIHRDLKPGNLLVTKSCQLRITDFGLARERPLGRGLHPDEEVDDPMTEHVITRWYRPPELMLCPDGLYTYAVDLWSVGCIFAELLGRKPLFPGSNFVDQLTLIFNIIGTPAPQEVAHIRNNQARRFLDSMAGKPKVPYATLFPHASEQAVDLLESVLVFDPPMRATVNDALNHSYFNPLRGAEGLPSNPPLALGLEFEFENCPNIQRLQLKQLILQEVDSFRREQRRKDKEKERERLISANLQRCGNERSYYRNHSVLENDNSSVSMGNSFSGNSQEMARCNISNRAIQAKETGQFPRTKSELSGSMHQYQQHQRSEAVLYNGSVLTAQEEQLRNFQPQQFQSAVQTRSMTAAEINRQRYLDQSHAQYMHEEFRGRNTLHRAYSAGHEMDLRNRMGLMRAPLAGNPHDQTVQFSRGLYKPRSPMYKQALWNHIDQSVLSEDEAIDTIGESQSHVSSSIPIQNTSDNTNLRLWRNGVR